MPAVSEPAPTRADFEAYLGGALDLIPLKRRDKAPRDGSWTTRRYDRERVIEEALADGSNVGVRLTDEMLVVDVDPRNGGDEGLVDLVLEVGDLSAYPTVITGSGGRHIYMRKPAGVALANGLPQFKGVEFKSAGRQVVAAGSVHPSGESYRWTKPPDLRNIPEAPAALVEIARRRTRDESRPSSERWGDTTVEQLQGALAQLRPEDFRDQDRWFTLMQACHHATAGEGFDAFADWSTSDPDYADHRERIRLRWESLRGDAPNPVTSAFLHRVLGEAGGGVPHADPSDDFEAVADEPGAAQRRRERFRVLSLSELEAMPPTRWLVRGVVPENALVAVYGHPGAGKSFLALDLAACVASDSEWHGRKVSPGGALYVAAEGVQGLGARVMAWRTAHGATGELPFHVVPHAVNLADAKEAQAFAEFAASLRQLRLVVVDTLARCLPGRDENSTADMGAFVAGCDAIRRATGATVLVVHHSGKDAGKGLRGSTALLGALDASILVRRSTDGASIEVCVEKQKDSGEEPAMTFRLDRVELPPGADGEPRSSLVLRDPPPEAEAQADFLDAVPRTVDGKVELLPLLAAKAKSAGGRVPLKNAIPLVIGTQGGSASSARRRIERDVPLGRKKAADAYGTRVWLEREGTHSTAPLIICAEGGEP